MKQQRFTDGSLFIPQEVDSGCSVKIKESFTPFDDEYFGIIVRSRDWGT